MNQYDAAALAAHWGQTGCTWFDGDFNDDGIVNAADASILAANWSPQTTESDVVPEPGLLALLAAASAWALLVRQRRRAGGGGQRTP